MRGQHVTLRTTALNDSTIRQRLGVHGNYVPINLLPKLEHAGVIREVAYEGRGSQHRWRLVPPMARIFGNRFSSSTSCSRWLHETEPGRLDQAFSCRFLKVATHPAVGTVAGWPGSKRGGSVELKGYFCSNLDSTPE